MADFTDKDRELLDKLRKAFEKGAKTRLQLEPWQELIDRDASLNANRAALAAKIVEGFAGSWAAQYHFGWGSLAQEVTAPAIRSLIEPDSQGPPVPIRAKTNHVGKRGASEINFAPYNWRTNTLGSKGPSLVGHPIAFEVVGPTLKSPFTDWTWTVTEGGGANGGDLLIPDVRPDGVVSPLVGDISDMYGPVIDGTWTIGDITEPNGGLYLVVSDDGANVGALAAGQTAMNALPLFVDTARYEIFRISEITLTSIEIHPNKSFSGHFDLPAAGTRSIRAITILKPYVTRLLAVPQSGAAGGNDGVSTSGREQTFVVVSPERAAGNDNFPPFLGAGGVGVGDGSWQGGGFSESRAPGSTAVVGAADSYGGAARLPIPNPVLEVTGTVEQAAVALPTTLIGEWLVATPPAPFTAGPFSSTNLPVVRISATTRNTDLPNFAFGSVESCLGWFDVVDTQGAGPPAVILARVPETAPDSGLTYWGPGPYVSSVAAPSVTVGMTLHEAIDNLWNNPVFQLDKVDASRLRNLIDPHWVSRFEKQISDPTLAGGQSPPPGGSGPGRPDRAIFSAQKSPGLGPIPEPADPGNLMNLGFRMVLFPAKEDPRDATQAIPDFDLPITGRALVIDGSIQEKQFVEIDYSSGVVRLSHPPPTSRTGVPDEDSDVIPNGIPGDTGNNPRAEVVLFAACVPYSMEDTQVGTGARITTHTGTGRDVDIASTQVKASIDQLNTTFVGVAPFFGVSGLTGAVDIVLDRLWDGPETGVVTINSGNDDSPAFGRWGYTEKKRVVVATQPRTALGGLSINPAAIDPTTPGPEEPRSVVFRREVILGAQSIDLPAVTDFYVTDTTFGSSLRSDTLRFQDSETRPNMDGSVSVISRSPGYVWHQEGTWAASGIFDVVSTGDRLDTQGVLAGVYYQDQTGNSIASPGFTTTGINGQFTSFTVTGVVADFLGVVTRRSQIRLEQQFRLVIKFSFTHDAATDFLGFVGLVGPTDFTGPPPVSSLASAAVATPVPSASQDYLGIRVDGTTPTAPLNFFSQKAGFPGTAVTRPSGATIGPALSTVATPPFYLVIETEPYFDPALLGSTGAFVKLGLFDAAFQEVGRTRVYNQDSMPRQGNPLEVVIAARNPSGGTHTSNLYYAKIVNHTELPFAVIP